MSRGPGPGRLAGVILAFAALAAVSLLLAGAVLALVAIGASGWRVVPASWPSWTNAPALAAVASSVILFGLIAVLLVVLLRDVTASGSQGGPLLNALWQETPSDLPARFNRMSGAEFEKEMAGLLHSRGYSVRRAPAPGGAPGVDLLLKKGNSTIAVQLKRWTAPVGDRAVQALFTGRIQHGADEAWLVTTSRFTPRARELARTTGVQLIDGAELATWLGEGPPERE